MLAFRRALAPFRGAPAVRPISRPNGDASRLLWRHETSVAALSVVQPPSSETTVENNAGGAALVARLEPQLRWKAERRSKGLVTPIRRTFGRPPANKSRRGGLSVDGGATLGADTSALGSDRASGSASASDNAPSSAPPTRAGPSARQEGPSKQRHTDSHILSFYSSPGKHPRPSPPPEQPRRQPASGKPRHTDSHILSFYSSRGKRPGTRPLPPEQPGAPAATLVRRVLAPHAHYWQLVREVQQVKQTELDLLREMAAIERRLQQVRQQRRLRLMKVDEAKNEQLKSSNLEMTRHARTRTALGRPAVPVPEHPPHLGPADGRKSARGEAASRTRVGNGEIGEQGGQEPGNAERQEQTEGLKSTFTLSRTAW